MNKLIPAIILMMFMCASGFGQSHEGLVRKVWLDVKGAKISHLTGHQNYPDTPTFVDTIDDFECPSDWSQWYGTRVEGFLEPNETGNYQFWIASNDHGELYLSTDETDANLVKIASVSGSTDLYEYTKYPSQESALISLVAGQRYRIVALHKEHSSTDNLVVAWQGGSITEPTVIAKEYLFTETDTAPPTTPTNPMFNASNQVVRLFWSPSTDDIGINHYIIYRDGVEVATVQGTTFNDLSVEASSSYNYEIKAVDVFEKESGALPYTVATPSAPTVGTGTGAFARYYDSKDFNDRKLVRIDPSVDFYWTNEPAAEIGEDFFSVIWDFELEPLYPGEEYTFTCDFNDFAVIWIDEQIVFQSKSGSFTIPTEIGKKYKFRIGYQEKNGNAEAKLKWESPSQPLAPIATSQMYPIVLPEGQNIEVSSEILSRTSPAWIEGTVGIDSDTITANSSNGDTIDIVRISEVNWYATASGALNVSPGVVLDPTNLASLSFVSQNENGTSETITSTIGWLPTIIGGEEVPDEIVIRVNDSLLLGAEVDANENLEIDLDYDGADFQPDIQANYDNYIPQKFITPGIFTVKARSDGVDVGALVVKVVGVDLTQAISCELNFTRQYSPVVLPASLNDEVHWGSLYPTKLMVQTDSAGMIDIMPFSLDASEIAGRIGGPSGPVIGKRKIDAFSLGTTATNGIEFVDEFEDGSVLTTAYLQISPNITNTTIIIQIYKAGVTFEDSTVEKDFEIEDFTLYDQLTQEYRHQFFILTPPSLSGGVCYRIKAYQGSVHVGGSK